MSERELAVSMPLDSDGFLRRECPTCEREFKWLPSEAETESHEPVGGYYCPYCGIQAPTDAWWTKAQLEFVNSVVTSELLEPELKKLHRSLHDLSRQSGGLITTSVETEQQPDAAPLVETEDMTRFDFDCHPDEPVKVLDDWDRDVHCLVCGSTAPVPASG